jgi:16S rRNA (guanine(966)-N(2))-methyltransferase RsmD
VYEGVVDFMRVISGSLKGRSIKGFDIEGTRPTMDRVKESVFGSIQNYVKDSVVLDLFAGSGNLGIEAISNGSKYCYFVDNNKICIKCIKDNLNEFNISNKGNVMLGDYNKALKYFGDNDISFDIIFVDPPYRYENINKVVDKIVEYGLLNNNGILVLEFRSDNVKLNDNIFGLRKAKKYGDKFVFIYQKLID